jgi:hypothetical protein
VRWLLLALIVFTLLTNAYWLRFLEPWVSRRLLGVAVILSALIALAALARVLPQDRAGWLALARREATPALLLVIVAAAFALRLWGITSGLPQSYVSDEYDFVHAGLKMIKGGDLNPHWWFHPSLPRYLAVATYAVVFLLQVPTGRWDHVHQITEEDMLYWGRFTGVMAGTGTVLIAFFLGRRLFGEKVGLLAAALLAVFPGAVQHSQYNKPDPIVAFMVALGVLVILDYLIKGGGTRAFVSGVTIGLAASAKYNGALLLVPFLLAVGLRHARSLLARPDVYLGGVGTLVGFLAGCPYFLSEIHLFLDHVAHDLYTYGFSGRPGAEGADNWWGHAVYTRNYGAGLWASLAGLGGLGLALHRLNGPLAVFLAFPVLYYSYYSAQRINFRGNIIPVYAFLAVLAAFAVFEAVALLQRRRAASARWVAHAALAASCVLLLGPPLRTAIRFNLEQTLPDTGRDAREWIERAIPAGAHLALERHTPVLDRARYRVTQEAKIPNRGVKSYREEGVEYLVVSSIAYDRFGPDHEQTKGYQKLFAICPLIAEFKPIPGQRSGPTIRVLRVPPGERAQTPPGEPVAAKAATATGETR